PRDQAHRRSAGTYKIAVVVDRRQLVLARARDDQIAMTHRPSARRHDQAAIRRARNRRNAALDLEPAHRLAMSVRRQSVELTGAAVGAVAVDEFASLDGPFRVCHGSPPEGWARLHRGF